MKVTYEKTVVDNIRDAVALAAKENRQIKEIQLTKEEWEEFSGGGVWLGQRDYGILHGVKVTFNGYFE